MKSFPLSLLLKYEIYFSLTKNLIFLTPMVSFLVHLVPQKQIFGGLSNVPNVLPIMLPNQFGFKIY